MKDCELRELLAKNKIGPKTRRQVKLYKKMLREWAKKKGCEVIIDGMKFKVESRNEKIYLKK